MNIDYNALVSAVLSLCCLSSLMVCVGTVIAMGALQQYSKKPVVPLPPIPPRVPTPDIETYMRMIPTVDYERELQGPIGPRASVVEMTVAVPFFSNSEQVPVTWQQHDEVKTVDQSRGMQRSIRVITYGADGSVFKGDDLAGFCAPCLAAGRKTPISIHNVNRCVYDRCLLCAAHVVVTPAGICCHVHAPYGYGSVGTNQPSLTPGYGTAPALLPNPTSAVNVTPGNNWRRP